MSDNNIPTFWTINMKLSERPKCQWYCVSPRGSIESTQTCRKWMRCNNLERINEQGIVSNETKKQVGLVVELWEEDYI
jgi:hypothetical protein